MKKGLILEGGAMRGLFTAGILDVFMENNIEFDGLVGVSAGAVFGCNYKSGQIGRTLRYNLKYCRDRRYCSFWNILLHGDMYPKKFCYHDIPEVLDVFEHFSRHINTEAVRSVVSRIIVRMDLVVQICRDCFFCMTQQILSDDHDSNTCRRNIFLCPCIYQSEFCHIDFFRQNVG